MHSYCDLVNNVNANTNAEEYLLAFFSKNNFSDYKIDDGANKDQTKAIKTLFESKKDLEDRIEDVFNYDPYCKEAMFAYLLIADSVYLQLRFDSYYKMIDEFGSFDDYTKNNFIEIMNMYVDFLLDIVNNTKAIEVQNIIVKLSKEYSKKAVSRLAYAYYSIEDSDNFYRLFANAKFGIYEYILLLVTLLKHDDFIKAKEVLYDLFKNNEYGIYLDHIWDLNDADPKQKEFCEIVDDCYEEISAVPTFFSWVNREKENYGK